MAIAWSSTSSKVIAHSPYAYEACRRRCWKETGRSGACIPHMVDKRKWEVLEVRDAEVMSCSQMRGGMCHESFDRLSPPQIHLEPGEHHVPRPTTHQKTRES